jgi:hypothetical protein
LSPFFVSFFTSPLKHIWALFGQKNAIPVAIGAKTDCYLVAMGRRAYTPTTLHWQSKRNLGAPLSHLCMVQP